MRTAGHLVGVLSLLAGACGGERQPAGEVARAAESAMKGMAMGAMPMPSLDMLPAVRGYLDSVARAGPVDLPGMVAGHGRRIEPMLVAMDQDMAAMNMTADSAWQALADSVRGDLTALPGLSGEALVLRMRAHAGRTRRLVDRHERMMRSAAAAYRLVEAESAARAGERVGPVANVRSSSHVKS